MNCRIIEPERQQGKICDRIHRIGISTDPLVIQFNYRILYSSLKTAVPQDIVVDSGRIGEGSVVSKLPPVTFKFVVPPPEVKIYNAMLIQLSSMCLNAVIHDLHRGWLIGLASH
jgi:hypothetical protein